MIVIELDREQNVILAGIRAQRRTEAARTGLHVSTIISDILNGIDSRRARYDEIDEGTGLAFQELGNALEEIVAERLSSRIPGWVKPCPKTRRGITGSPDGYSPRARCIDEIKVIWASEKDFLDATGRDDDGRLSGTIIGESVKFIGFKMQILFYMKLWAAERARLHTLFVTGSGRPPFPKPRTFLLKPSRAEIDANYYMIRQHAMDRGWLAAAA